jgi:hypothetical protein
VALFLLGHLGAAFHTITVVHVPCQEDGGFVELSPEALASIALTDSHGEAHSAGTHGDEVPEGHGHGHCTVLNHLEGQRSTDPALFMGRLAPVSALSIDGSFFRARSETSPYRMAPKQSPPA